MVENNYYFENALSTYSNYCFRWKPFGFPVYCDKENTFFKHEIDDFDTNM